MAIHRRGFTLIELLVVVAIIGMLSSIVLSSLTVARDKAGDASVKANLRSVKNAAALYQSTNNNYGPTFAANTCPSSGTSMFYVDLDVRNAIAAARSAGGNGSTRCASNGNDFAVSVRLKSVTTSHWCVDSAGASKEITNLAWTGVACP